MPRKRGQTELGCPLSAVAAEESRSRSSIGLRRRPRRWRPDTITGNGKTITINASGPGSITIFPDGNVVEVLEGHTIYFNTPDKGIFLFDGLVVVDTSSGTIASHNGHVTDVCALLR